jgi:hypothetical protein
MGGPLKDFRKWHFNIAGKLNDLIITNLPENPGPVKIESLHFSADPKKLSYSANQLNFLDTLLTVTGSNHQFMKNIGGDVHLVFDGQVGRETTKWLSSAFDMPDWLKLQPLTLTQSELNYAHHTKHNLSATLGLKEDLKLFADVSMDANEINLKNIRVEDHFSQATINGIYTKPMLTISFDGKLHETTLRRFFEFDNPSSTSIIDGNTQIRLNLKNTNDVSIVGKLSGQNFSIPTSF